MPPIHGIDQFGQGTTYTNCCTYHLLTDVTIEDVKSILEPGEKVKLAQLTDSDIISKFPLSIKIDPAKFITFHCVEPGAKTQAELKASAQSGESVSPEINASQYLQIAEKHKLVNSSELLSFMQVAAKKYPFLNFIMAKYIDVMLKFHGKLNPDLEKGIVINFYLEMQLAAQLTAITDMDFIHLEKISATAEAAERMMQHALTLAGRSFFAPKVTADGADEIRKGWVEKTFFQDRTGQNILQSINLSIFDPHLFSDQPHTKFNFVFNETTIAGQLREFFTKAEIEMTPTGTGACAFTSFASLNPAFEKFIELGIISKTNAKDMMTKIQIFMENRNLIAKPAASFGPM